MKKLSPLLFFMAYCSLSWAQYAVNFDGTDDYIESNLSMTAVSGSATRTVEFWVQTTNTTSSQTVMVDWGTMTVGHRFTINMISNGKLRAEVGGNGFNSTTTINDGNWHHVAITYNNSATQKCKMYIDGTFETSHNFTQTVNTSSTPILIGRRNDQNNYFQGTIDELRVWTTERSAADISSNMNNEFCAPSSDLYLYYKFNQGTGATSPPTGNQVVDRAGANMGNMYNFAFTGSTSNWVAGKTLNAVGGNTTAGNVMVTACNSYTSPSGSYTWNTSGNYNDTIPSASGCDSVLNINLTVLPNATNNLNATGCNTYTVPSGNQTYTQSGTVYDTLPSANGCDSILTIALTINTVDTSVLANGAYLTSYANGAAYQWLDCDNNFAPIAGATNQTYQATANGNYAVEIDDNGCIDTSGCHNVDNISIGENQLDHSIAVYPNPAKHFINVEMDYVTNEVQIDIVNALGKVVARSSFNGQQKITFPIDLPAGIYFVRIVQNEQTVIKKIAVH